MGYLCLSLRVSWLCAWVYVSPFLNESIKKVCVVGDRRGAGVRGLPRDGVAGPVGGWLRYRVFLTQTRFARRRRAEVFAIVRRRRRRRRVIGLVEDSRGVGLACIAAALGTDAMKLCFVSEVDRELWALSPLVSLHGEFRWAEGMVCWLQRSGASRISRC